MKNLENKIIKKYTGPFVARSKQGEIKTSKSKLIEVFGKPHEKNICDKIKYEWVFELPNKNIVSIYPYKYSPKKDEMFRFSIAGKNEFSAKQLIDFFDSYFYLKDRNVNYFDTQLKEIENDSDINICFNSENFKTNYFKISKTQLEKIKNILINNE